MKNMHCKIGRGRVWVIVGDDGYMQMYSPSGEILAWNVKLSVSDGVDELPSVSGTWVCNIAGTKEEMLQQIKEWNENPLEYSPLPASP